MTEHEVNFFSGSPRQRLKSNACREALVYFAPHNLAMTEIAFGDLPIDQLRLLEPFKHAEHYR